MKRYAVRALQILTMSDDQLERIHRLEEVTHYILPNWNIQEIMGLSSIKEYFNFPYDVEDLAKQMVKVQDFILSKDLVPHEQLGFVETGNVSYTHDYDRKIIERRNDFDFSSMENAVKSRLRLIMEGKKKSVQLELEGEKNHATEKKS